MSGIFIFDKSQNLYKTIPDKKILANYQEQELNGLISGTCQVEYSSDLEDAFFYGVKDEDKFWLYSIKNAIKKENTITFKGVHIMYDDLKGKVVRDLRPNNKLVGSVCTSILVGTGWECVSHCNVRGSANFYYQSSLSALYKIAQKFGVDFIPVIKFSDGKIVAKEIHIYSKLGEDLGKVFSYKDNLVQVVAETSSDELFTAFIGRGKGEMKTDESGKATGGYGRKIKFDSIDYKDTIDGVTVHSPIGSDMIEIKEATKIYGYPDGSPRICTVDFDDIEDKRELATATFKYAIEHSRPRAQLRAKGHAYERIGIGEIVTIIGPMDIRFKTRIYKLKKDFLSKKILDFEFGDKIVKSMSDRLKDSQINSKANEINDISFMDSIFTMIESTYYNEDGYQYDLKPDNKYKLPAGLYSFNKPIDQNPDKVIYLGAGKLMIANSKKDDGSWNFRVALNGDSVNADEIRAGILRGGKVRWNLEDGTFIIGNNPTDYNLYWDGSTLHLRNVDIDLENNRTIQDLKNKQGMTDKEIAARKEEIESAKKDLQEAKTSLEGSISEVSNNVGDLDNRLDQQDEKNKLVSKDILDLKTNLKITDGKIQTSVESINKTVEEKIRANKDYINEKDTSLRTYLNNNYSSISQTDEKISSEVVKIQIETEEKIRLGDNNLKSYITQNYTTINQTNKKIEATVKSFKDDMSKYESRFTQLKDEISLQVSSSKQSGVYKNLIKNAYKWDGNYIRWFPRKNDKGVAQGGRYYIESNGDVRFASNKETNTWTSFLFELIEIEAIRKEFTVICEPSEMKDSLQYLSFDLLDKDFNFISNYTYFNQKDRIYKLVVKDDKSNKIPKYLRISFKDSQAGTDKDRSVVIPQGKLALVKGWHPNLTWNDIYTPNEQGIEELRSELKVKVDEISASVKNKIKGLESKISIQADRISSKVSRGDVISEINQSPEQVKIRASKIDLTGNVSVRGDFATYDGYGDIGVEISYNRVRWRDNRWENKSFGEINVVKSYSSDYNYTFSIGHFKTGRSMISYNDGSSWYPYVTFDRWNYTGNGGPSHPVCFNEGVRFKGECKFQNIIHFDHMRLREYTNGIALENYDGNGLFVDRDGSVWIMKGSRRYEVDVK
ncbi:phage tail spike protein [Anaerococcus tetradius]|uniref:phage tail spike protein n=1 Tax=Anaerococcus tetradius TaxID=33036 RepID=UPI0023F0733A|nr:phage tail spike protein [Anaerococcus tetradius]